MSKRDLLQVGWVLALSMAAAVQSYTQTVEVISLRSPNKAVGGGFGISVSGAGDIDQDGFADVIVGALGEPPSNGGPDQAGRAYVISGRDLNQFIEFISPHQEAGGNFRRFGFRCW